MKTLFKQYLWLIVLIAVAFLGVGTFFIAGIYQEKKFDKTVNSQTNAANKAVQESRNESGAAANYSIERRAEDAIREKVITPKLDDARRRSDNSKQDLVISQNEYENRKKNLSNLNRNAADNCDQLKRLYPNVQFEYCQQR